MKWRAWIFAVAVLFIVVVAPVGAEGLKPGDRVRVTGRGWWNPACTGLLGAWWEFNNPTDHALHCGCMGDVPDKGVGLVTPDNDGDWLYNRNYRVCTSAGCGWYPADALLAPIELPMVLKGDISRWR